MVNIWGFLVQTLEVSLVAVVILGLKLLFRDKLSARWQYGIWSVLLVGLVWPRGCTGRFVWRTPQVALQAVKTITESSLASRFTRAEKVVYNTSFVPYITGRPASITDIAFVIYVAGAAVCIVRYMVSYFRLSALVAAAGTDRELQRLTDKTAAMTSLVQSDPVHNIDMVGTDLDMGQGMCGSSSGSVPTNVGQPLIRVSTITVGGR